MAVYQATQNFNASNNCYITKDEEIEVLRQYHKKGKTYFVCCSDTSIIFHIEKDSFKYVTNYVKS